MAIKTRNEIILIGPMAAGKTACSQYINKLTGLPICSIDAVRKEYMTKAGVDYWYAMQLKNTRGSEAFYYYTKPFRIKMIKHILDDFKGHIFDFGAEDSIAEDEDDFRILSQTLDPFNNIFFMLPHETKLDCMLEITRKPNISITLAERNKRFIENPSNARLAKHTIIRGGRPIEEVAKDILGKSIFVEQLNP